MVVLEGLSDSSVIMVSSCSMNDDKENPDQRKGRKGKKGEKKTTLLSRTYHEWSLSLEAPSELVRSRTKKLKKRRGLKKKRKIRIWKMKKMRREVPSLMCTYHLPRWLTRVRWRLMLSQVLPRS